jgi:dppC2
VDRGGERMNAVQDNRHGAIGQGQPSGPQGVPASMAPALGGATPGAQGRAASASPAARAWQRFRRHRRGYISLWIFGVLFGISLFAGVLSNDRPLLASYQGQWYTPLWHDYPETTFGGDFLAPTEWHDPFIQRQLGQDGNWALWPLNRYSFNTLNYYAELPNPAPPSAQNLLGTDDRGRDVLARLLYGFRLSVMFGLALTAIGTLLGIVMGALQGYFAGRVDITLQRLIEVWSAIPELYLLLILASMFEPSIWVLLVILSLFGWMGLSDYVRAEFLRNRQLEFVQAARALGLPRRSIILRHILPNSLTPVLAFLPFRMSAAIVALASLDFLGLGVSDSSPSLGELLAQGKNNLDAWWIALPTFGVLVGTLLLLIFIGEALRDALDPRKR